MELFPNRFDAPARLRELLVEGVVAPGTFDPFSARLAERAGARAVYMTGNGASAARTGRADVGLMTASEMVDQAGRIADAVAVPLIADGDTGYGGPLNVMRTIREYERAGVAAVHLEDQALPKRCGQLGGTRLVEPDEHAGRIAAAVAARTGPTGIVIIGRTDAVGSEGVEAAVDRARTYGEAGADALFVEGLESVEALEFAAGALSDWPLVYPWVGGRSPEVSAAQLHDMGFGLVIYPVVGILAAMGALSQVYDAMVDGSAPAHLAETELPSLGDYSDFLGAPEAGALEAEFGQGRP